MVLYSSFAGFIEVMASPGKIVVDDNLFGEHPWLTLIIEPVFLYGQTHVVLPSFLIDCSVLLQSPMVCVWIMHSISHQLSFGTVYCCKQPAYEPCIHSEDTFRLPKHSRQREIWLDNLMQNHQLVIAPRCLELNGVGVISEIVPALCCVDEFIHLVSMVSEAVLKMLLVFRELRVMDTDGYGLYATDVAIPVLQLIAEEFLFCSTNDTKLRKFTLELLERFGFVGWNHVSTLLKLNLKLSPDIGDRQLDVSSYHLFDVNIHPVSLQSYRQDFDLIRQTIVAHSGWFGSILEFLYGSLPRPPDVLYVFSSKPYNSHGVFKSKMRGTLYPVSVVKTRLQVSSREIGEKSAFSVVKGILKNDGVPGLYRGFGTVITGAVPARIIFLTAVETTKISAFKLVAPFELSEPTQAAIANGIAGMTTSLFSQAVLVPIDVVSQKLLVQGYSGHAKYTGGIDVATKIIKSYGARGLYRGFGLSVMTYSPSSTGGLVCLLWPILLQVLLGGLAMDQANVLSGDS